MSDAYSVGFKDGAAAGYKLAIEDMKLDKKPQIMKKYEGDHASLLARYNALVEAVKWERECIYAWEYVPTMNLHAIDEQVASMNEARAEVDRLLNG